MYSKTPVLKKTAAHLTALSSLIAGALLFLLGGKMPLPVLSQTLGMIFLVIAIYVMSCYLLREYIFCVEESDRASDGGAAPDLVIYERRGAKKIRVCRLGFDEISSITAVDRSNRARIKEERKGMRRFRYNAQYAAQKFIEVRAEENISVFMTYDRELLEVLSSYLEIYGKRTYS